MYKGDRRGNKLHGLIPAGSVAAHGHASSWLIGAQQFKVKIFCKQDGSVLRYMK